MAGACWGSRPAAPICRPPWSGRTRARIVFSLTERPCVGTSGKREWPTSTRNPSRISAPPVWPRSLVPFALLSGILLVLLGGDHSAWALPIPDRVERSFQADTLERVRFQEATDLEVDPRGQLYVAD